MPILQLIWSYCELVLSRIQTRIRISRKKWVEHLSIDGWCMTVRLTIIMLSSADVSSPGYYRPTHQKPTKSPESHTHLTLVSEQQGFCPTPWHIPIVLDIGQCLYGRTLHSRCGDPLTINDCSSDKTV